MKEEQVRELERRRAAGQEAAKELRLAELALEVAEAEALANLRTVVQDAAQAHLWGCRLWAVDRVRSFLRSVVSQGVAAENAIHLLHQRESTKDDVVAAREEYLTRARKAREEHAERLRRAAEATH